MNKLELNPWLADIVLQCKRADKGQKMRLAYEKYVKTHPSLSWAHFCELYALREKHLTRSVPIIRLWRMPLSEKTKEGLYWNHVDIAADLAQMSEEELDYVATKEGFDAAEVRKYLEWLGIKLHSCSRRTYKIRSVAAVLPENNERREQWSVEDPGARRHWDIRRPALYDEWFEEYYRKYEYLDKEERFRDEFLAVEPIGKDGAVLSDAREFLEAANNLWMTYELVCSDEGFPAAVPMPELPENYNHLEEFGNDRFLLIKREAAKVIIDVMSHTDKLDSIRIGKYLVASDEDRVVIAEDSGAFMDLQMLLMSHEEIRICFENLCGYLDWRVSARNSKRPLPIK